MVAAIILVAIVVQTTLFSRVEFVTPDLVMLTSILLALTRVRPEAVLGIAFLSGLVVDLLGSSLTGLRAVVFTVVAYLAVRTRERASIGRPATAIWAGAHTLLGVLLLVLVGTLFGQTNLLGPDVGVRIVVVPLTNTLLAGIAAPAFVRLVDGDSKAFRFS
jgi:rod shape-determining protein MreD